MDMVSYCILEIRKERLEIRKERLEIRKESHC